jgi:hypothetical protein
MTTLWYSLAAVFGLAALAGVRGRDVEPIRVRVRRPRRR